MNCDDTDYGIDNIKVNKSYTINGMCFDCAPGHHHHDHDDDRLATWLAMARSQTPVAVAGGITTMMMIIKVLGLGDHLVTMIVTDNNGNAATCRAAVSVVDDLAPVAKCRNTSVSLGNDGEASLEAYRVNKYSYDNCGRVWYDYSVSPSDFDCSHVGDNVVVLTVTDNSGNTSTCEATVTVEDNKKPHIHCLQNKTLIFDETCTAIMPDYTGNATVSDNCSAIVTQYRNQVLY
ncbi:MAG: hypothetical protein R2778_09775 [Saprospiraceae bacterium]